MFSADLDNDDKGLMEAKLNIMQVSVALNQGTISSYHLVHCRVEQEADFDKNVCLSM